MPGTEQKPSQGSANGGFLAALTRLSDRVVRIERPVMGLLIAALFSVVMLNLVCRSLGWALYWADELAVYLMIWAALVGASISVKLRTGVSVRLIHDYMGPRGVKVLDTTADALVLLSTLCLLAFSWIWYDPILLIRSGFDIAAFKSTSFNFIYHEPTVTLAIKKFWLWSVMPLVAITMTLHACSNLAQSLSGRAQNIMRRGT